MVAGSLAWGACLFLMASNAWLTAAALITAGLLMGLPVGVIMSLPAQALRPESRGLGMGLFYTGLYLGHGLLPPFSGWLQDSTGSPEIPLYFAMALALAMVPL